MSLKNLKKTIIGKKTAKLLFLFFLPVFLFGFLYYGGYLKGKKEEKKPVGIKSEEIKETEFKKEPEEPKKEENKENEKLPKVDLYMGSELKKEKVYTSDIKTTSFEFNALAPIWKETVPEGTSLEIFVRVGKGEGWSTWFPVEASQGKDGVKTDEKFSEFPIFYVGNKFQYKVILKGDGVKTPVLEEIRFNYIDARGNIIDKVYGYLKNKAQKAKAAYLGPSIVSRSGWGSPEPNSSAGWTPEYQQVEKIVVHHTVSQNNPSDPAADVRAIWYYHTFTQGWGDIGYNFLVDQNGTIYQGRYGGDQVVGGHTYGYNRGSMGIAALGDFSSYTAGNPMLDGISNIAGWKSAMYNINPSGSGLFVDRNTNNIAGHRDYTSTSCPGNGLYSPLGYVRTKSTQVFDSSIVNQITVTNSLALSNNSPAAGEDLTATFTLTNKSSDTVSLGHVGVGNRLNSYTNKDFTWDTNITLAPGASHSFSKTQRVADAGSYRAWAAFSYQGVFFEARADSAQTVSKEFTARIPNVKATTVISLNPSSPMKNQSTAFTVNVKNNETKRIYFSHLGLANRKLDDLTNHDIGWLADSYIEPNETKTLSFNKSFSQGGDYKAWTAIHIGNNWYDVWDNLNPSHRYFSVTDLSLTSSLTLSNNSPAIGEQVTATYTIQNKSTNQVTLGHLGVAARLNTYTNRDFPWLTDITLQPYGQAGDSYNVSVQKTFTDVGSLYAWAAYSYQGVFYNAKATSTQAVSKSFSTHVPNIKATSVIASNPTSPLAGQQAAFTVTLQNNEQAAVNYSHLGLANRKISDMSNHDIGWNANGSLPVGSTTLTFNKTLTQSGDYKAWTTMHVGNSWFDVWDNLNPSHLYFNVKNPETFLTVTTPLALSNNNPAIGENLTFTYSLKNKGSQAITLGHVGVANRLNNYTNKDIGWAQNITIQPNATYDVSVSRIFTDVGSYNAWAAYSVGGVFYNARPDASQAVSKNFVTRVPNIKASTVISLNPSTVLTGQSNNYSVTLHNYEIFRINYSYLGIANRSLVNSGNYDIGWDQNSYLDASSSKTISFDKTLTVAGGYYASTHIGIGGNFYQIWDTLNPNSLTLKAYDQTATLEGITIPATSGLTAVEQHLNIIPGCTAENYLTTRQSAADHYAQTGAPLAAQNGMAWQVSGGCGYGAWGAAPPLEDERYYVNMRWNYTTDHGQVYLAPKSWYYRKKVIITNPANGKRVLASVIEYGPHPSTGRVSGLSPEAMLAIGAVTNNNLNYYWASDQTMALGPLN